MRHVDLAVIGSGSGNSIIDERFDDLSVALIDDGDPFGGTCLNVGCIPSKMFTHTAEVADEIRGARRYGLHASAPTVDWPAIRDRIFGRIDPISLSGLGWRESQQNVSLMRGTARFTGVKRLSVSYPDGSEEALTADRIVLAAGSRPRMPAFPGLDAPELEDRVHTSDTIMRLERLPRTMVILGGGFVAVEFAHIFSALGVAVTLINRSSALLRHADAELATSLTDELSRRVVVRLNQSVVEVDGSGRGGIGVYTMDHNDIEYSYDAEVLLVATGRIPNSDRQNLPATGVDVDGEGFVVVDAHQRTTADGIFALGDVSNHHMLKHAANADARTVQHNLLHPDDLASTEHTTIPYAVFSDPQLASVGLTEQELRRSGTPYTVGVQRYADVAYGWALEDRGIHVAKVLVDPESLQLLGCHILGPQASTLIQPAIQAMATGLDARTMARGQYWIHPALTEVLENALLQVAPDR
ncbi:MAG TPA: mycothione reductase [Propionibacteriaceae bacterium]|nr:mycothione reductase [Propionibacteriaceae bacterium]